MSAFVFAVTIDKNNGVATSVSMIRHEKENFPFFFNPFQSTSVARHLIHELLMILHRIQALLLILDKGGNN
jgi:hypothetical protein